MQWVRFTRRSLSRSGSDLQADLQYLTVEYNAPISFLPYKVECPPFLLQLDPVIADIADEIMSRAILPEKARTDALHIATVAHHRIQYLLTWNCRHIANARILPRIHKVLAEMNVPIPIICTPEELLGDDTEIDN